MKEYIIMIDQSKPDVMGSVPLTKPPKELIRCKDCKNSGMDSSGINGYWCPAHVEWHDGNWYCADGERKE